MLKLHSELQLYLFEIKRYKFNSNAVNLTTIDCRLCADRTALL